MDNEKVKQKRGRKSKLSHVIESQHPPENIIISTNEPILLDVTSENTNTNTNTITNNDNDTVDASCNNDPLPEEEAKKKRGRKPNGGKIIQQVSQIILQNDVKQTVILHLKCSLKDLDYTGDHESNFTSTNITPFNFDNKLESSYETIEDPNTKNNVSVLDDMESIQPLVYDTKQYTDVHYNTNLKSVDEDNIKSKDVWKKLKELEQNLYSNNISDKKPACFWCSYDFDNPSIYIPKQFIRGVYQVYGCFCSPECAVAHLMAENIDSSIKFERYHLMNHVYSNIYEYKQNIKPAPDPHYMLEKFYGNLTIQEYRMLLKSDKLFSIVDKPLTRILPEFHEDNEDFIINQKIIPSNTYQMKKTGQRKLGVSK